MMTAQRAPELEKNFSRLEIRKMKGNEAPKEDEMTAEFIKNITDSAISWTQKIVNKLWNESKVQ